MKLTLTLAKPIAADLAADVEKQAVYAATEIRKLRVEGDRVEVEHDGDEAQVRAKVERFVAQMAQKHRTLERKELACNRRRDAGAYERDVYGELKRRGWALELGRGQIGLAGPALRLAKTLDAECARIGTERFAAVEEAYPALIPAEVLGRCGYFASFPQAVSLVAHLVEDFDAIEQFRQANAQTKELTIPDPRALPTPEACLTPAVCYHCYQALEGRTLTAGRCATASGKCFRYESKNITGLERLWDFTMREVIFVGTESWVTARRAQAIEAVTAQIAEWDLEAVIETANDPFFPTVHANRTYWQVRGDLKFELRLNIEPERTLACGSFNLHQSFFGNTFRIVADDGYPAFTGCVGWGLERWVLAGFAQHGYERSRWPAHLASEIFG